MKIPVASIFSGKFEFDLALPAAPHDSFSTISNLRLHILNIFSNEPEPEMKIVLAQSSINNGLRTA